jgi:hypothetical protein
MRGRHSFPNEVVERYLCALDEKEDLARDAIMLGATLATISGAMCALLGCPDFRNLLQAEGLKTLPKQIMLMTDYDAVKEKRDGAAATAVFPNASDLLTKCGATPHVRAAIEAMVPSRQIAACLAMTEMHDTSLPNAIALLAATPTSLLKPEFKSGCRRARGGAGARLLRQASQTHGIETVHGIRTLEVIAAKATARRIMENSRLAAHISEHHALLWDRFQGAIGSSQPKRPRGARWPCP